MSEAKHKFDKIIKRCNVLIKLYDEQKQENSTNNDLARAAIVLSVAAFDGYITDVFVEYFKTFLENTSEISDKTEKKLVDIGITVKIILNSLQTDSVYEQLYAVVRQHYEKVVTQRMEVINNLFTLYGLNNITENSEKKSGVDMLIKSIEDIVQRRHVIVHKGDYNSSGKINSISEDDIDAIKKITILVHNMDEIIENRFK